MTDGDRTTGELGRSIDTLATAVEALRGDLQRFREQLDDIYPRKEVVDLQIYELRHDVSDLKQADKDRTEFAANTRRMVYLALLSALLLTPISALLLATIRGH